MCFVDPVPAGSLPTPGPPARPLRGSGRPGGSGPGSNKTNFLLTCAGRARAAPLVVPPPCGLCACLVCSGGRAAHMRAGAATGGHGAATAAKNTTLPAYHQGQGERARVGPGLDGCPVGRFVGDTRPGPGRPRPGPQERMGKMYKRFPEMVCSRPKHEKCPYDDTKCFVAVSDCLDIWCWWYTGGFEWWAMWP